MQAGEKFAKKCINCKRNAKQVRARCQNNNFPKSVALWNLSDSAKLILFHFFALDISADSSLNRGLDLFESSNGDSERGSLKERVTVMKEQIMYFFMFILLSMAVLFSYISWLWSTITCIWTFLWKNWIKAEIWQVKSVKH